MLFGWCPVKTWLIGISNCIPPRNVDVITYACPNPYTRPVFFCHKKVQGGQNIKYGEQSISRDRFLKYSNSNNQSGRSPKVVALFSATNLSSYIIELLKLHDAILIKWNYTRIHYNIAIKSHSIILKEYIKFHFGTKFSSIFMLHGKN